MFEYSHGEDETKGKSVIMGYMRHHAIVVTSWNKPLLARARVQARSLFSAVSPMIESPVNGYHSFFVPPDGSKEGWEESKRGDRQRREFVRWLDGERHEDDSSSLDWIEIQYGDEDGESKICAHSDEHRWHRWRLEELELRLEEVI